MSLRERCEIVSLYRAAPTASAGGVLFSVVRVAGSSYRQPGARMLVLPDGRTAGTLSGGCLEADLLRRAAWTVRDGAVVERFSTAFDDTAEIPYGLGCGGEIDLLAEPLGTLEAAALMDALHATVQQDQRTVATLLPQPSAARSAEKKIPLARVVLDGRFDVLFASEFLPTEAVVQIRSLVRAQPEDKEAASWLDTPLGPLFVERLQPMQRLVIFGAGEDARPLARMAVEMGWVCAVVDPREKRLTAERFPNVDRLAVLSAAEVPVVARDAVVLMTHSYEQDRALLAELLPLRPRYLGLLGARHRSALLLQEASALAGVPLDRAVAATHAPIGLELGGEGPEAVSLAIAAEIQHALSGKGEASAIGSRRLRSPDVERLLDGGPPAIAYGNCALSLLEEDLFSTPEAVAQ